MASALGFQGGIIGIGEEVTTYASPVTITKFAEMNSDGLVVNEERIHSQAVPAIYSDDDEVAQGQVACAGDVAVELRYQGFETFFKHALGAVSTAEVASFIVVDSGATQNNKLDFDIGSTALAATVTAGTYIAGTDQTTALSLCKAIYEAIHSAEASGTYTVTFSHTTKKFTIAETGGTVTVLNLKWNTGANKLIGIAALTGYSTATDDTGAQTYAADTAVVTVYDHTFTMADALPLGLTVEIDRDVDAFTYAGGKINTLGLSLEANNFLMATFGFIANQETHTASPTSPTLPTAPLILFSQGVVQYASSATNIKKFDVNLNNQLSTDRRFIGTRVMAEPQRSAKVEVTGTISMEFEDDTKFADFRAMISRAIILTCTGVVIKGALTYVMTINLPVVKLTGNNPTINGAGIITVDYPFKAYASDSSNREMNIVIRNSLASV